MEKTGMQADFITPCICNKDAKQISKAMPADSERFWTGVGIVAILVVVGLFLKPSITTIFLIFLFVAISTTTIVRMLQKHKIPCALRWSTLFWFGHPMGLQLVWFAVLSSSFYPF